MLDIEKKRVKNADALKVFGKKLNRKTLDACGENFPVVNSDGRIVGVQVAGDPVEDVTWDDDKQIYVVD